jgi:MFS family permease
MFIARFFLGFGIGPKSATVPIYAAEASPPSIRGALVMQWQMWTAFGIMVGYAADLAFYQVPDSSNITGLNWRLMMGSAMLPAVVVVCFVFLCPESPRWYISKNRHSKAWQSIQRLRYNKVQAARDLFYIQFLIKAENEAAAVGQNKVREMVSVPRNRRAMIASEIVMFMQQLYVFPYNRNRINSANLFFTAAASTSCKLTRFITSVIPLSFLNSYGSAVEFCSQIYPYHLKFETNLFEKCLLFIRSLCRSKINRAECPWCLHGLGCDQLPLRYSGPLHDRYLWTT